ncbi:uncharacterized protein LOC143365818 [Halictus rubicundus]|uniref:uncharacterized protein LOC143365818 n=1 Tax=Halictus rubicundus TaxID=77578 RepID=UPI00403747AC
MIPTRTTRSSSRRSSILKPPKPRQPLQNLNFTNSFNESSPTVTTTKLKRRVSFAEKKHVKEFCNSLEQGTVWDSTYEEHDLSNLKVPCIFNKDCNESTCKENVEITTDHHNDLVSVNSETVDKCTINETSICYIREDHEAVSRVASEEIELIYKQPTEKEVLPDSSPKIFHSTARETNESVLSLDLPVGSESYVNRCFVLFEDPAVNVSSKVVTDQYSNANNFKSNKMNATCVMNMHMGFTEALSHNVYPSINFTEEEKISETLENTMSEFREVVPTSIQLLNNMKSVQQPIEGPNPNCYKSPIRNVDLKAYSESPQNFNNLSIDMTMAVSTIPFNLQEKEPYVEHTQNFNGTLMEMTTVTTHAECSKHFDDDSMEMTDILPTGSCNLQEKETYTERTKNFNNASMEMTAAVPTRSYNLQEKETYAERTKNFNNASMEMTAAVPTRSCNLQEKETYTERTQNFNNVSMEMTAAVPTRACNMQGKETYTERTKNFNNASMEMTAAVPTRSYNLQEKETYAERTKNFNNASMEMTAAVPTRSCNLQEKETYTERTQNFNNASMEMTAALPTRSYNMQGKETYTERTKNFNNASMEMTAAVPTRSYNLQEKETYAERTKNFNNVSMEMTAAVSTRACNMQGKETYTERTKNFNNVSMEMTAAVPTRACNMQGKETYAEHTKNFNNASMEMTAAVPTRSYNLQGKETYTERTQNFNNVSMEMTAAVPTRACNMQGKETYTERTKNFNNASMEMTAAVPTRSYNLQEKETYAERTKNFNNASIEMTAAVPTRSCNLQGKETYTERTQNFNNVSMEMTAAVSTRACNMQGKETYTERTKNFNNASMEMTAAVPTRSYNMQGKETYTERTKNFNNASMEMTAAVPTRSYNLQGKETYTERTKNFNNASMEMTTAVPTRSCNLQEKETYAEHTKNFNNASMEMTAAVPTRSYNMQGKETYTERTQNFNNVSMEMTAAVSTRACNMQGKETYTERTKNFNNASMEMTAAVPTRSCNLQEKETYMEWTKNFNDASMEMTTAIPMRLCNLQSEAYLECTKNFKDVSMEITGAVSTKLYGLQEERLNNDKTTSMFHDVSIDITEAVPINVYADRMQRDEIRDDILSSINTIQQNENDTTCMNDKIMNITETGNGNNFENSRCSANSHRTESFDKTEIYNDKGMEFTAAISTVLKMQSGNLDVKSDKTRIFHDNSMTTTAVVSCLNDTGTVLRSRNVNVESDKTRIFDGDSMAITAVVPPLNVSEEKVENHESNVNAQDSHKTKPSLESIPQREDYITNMSEITRTRLPENIENRSSSTDFLKRSSIPDNVLKDITALIVPPLLDSSESSEERNCTMNHAEFLEAKIVEEPSSSEVPGLVDIEANTALHDSPVQDISASALNLDNTGAACGTPNSASNDFLYTVTPDANQGECLPHKRAKDTVPYPRRTFTIKPLSTDHSFTDNINEYSQSKDTNNDVQNTNSFQAQAFFEKSCTLLDKGLEELEAIKPPSFLCLDDSVEDVPMNTNCSREVVSPSKTVQDLPEETLKLDQQKVVDESRKEICLEAQRIQLSFNGSDSAEVQEFECSSSTTNNDPKICTYNVISPPRDKDTWNNSNTENQNMEQSVLDRSDFAEEKHLQSDEVKLHSNGNTLNNAMEIELQEIDPQISLAENDVSIELDQFSSLVKELRTCAQSDEIIWEVYHENIERKWFIVGFISCSLLIVVYLRDDYDISGGQMIKDIKIISRLADDADTLISMVHRLILEKIYAIKSIDLYKSVEDITLMLDYVSKEVKLALNFMFELKRLDDLNLMTVTRDSVSFVSHTKKMDIVLRVTVIIKPFEKINSQDIGVHCILGSVREDEIKKLIKNVKKDHKFLRRFMNDVRDYIYLMEVSAFATNVPY